MFTCISLTVMPRIMDQCYKRIPAVIHRKNIFIDLHTKILQLHASETPCIIGLQTIEGDYFKYLPPSNTYYDKVTQDISPKGLYQTLVAKHLKLDFLHHFSATSYAIFPT